MPEQGGTFWRRLDWRLWRQAYMTRTPEAERLAWILPIGKLDGSPAPAAERALAHVRDISLGGLILLLSRPLESGALLRVEIQSAARKTPHSLLTRVIHVEQRQGGLWTVSCCFVKELSDEELRLFGAERVRPTGSDVRAWVRYPCDVELVFYSVVAAAREKCPARIVNISAGGIALCVHRQFESGTLLRLELSADVQSLRKLTARVVHLADKKDGTYVLGCTFATELTGDDLPLLE